MLLLAKLATQITAQVSITAGFRKLEDVFRTTAFPDCSVRAVRKESHHKGSINRATPFCTIENNN